jgi:hypothetical protein
MDRVRTYSESSIDDLVCPQIRFRACGSAQGDREIRVENVGRPGIRIGVHRDSANTRDAGAADDSSRYLSAVGDQEGGKSLAAHGRCLTS